MQDMFVRLNKIVFFKRSMTVQAPCLQPMWVMPQQETEYPYSSHV